MNSSEMPIPKSYRFVEAPLKILDVAIGLPLTCAKPLILSAWTERTEKVDNTFETCQHF